MQERHGKMGADVQSCVYDKEAGSSCVLPCRISPDEGNLDLLRFLDGNNHFGGRFEVTWLAHRLLWPGKDNRGSRNIYLSVRNGKRHASLHRSRLICLLLFHSAYPFVRDTTVACVRTATS
jgi:hypothetical protein